MNQLQQNYRFRTLIRSHGGGGGGGGGLIFALDTAVVKPEKNRYAHVEIYLLIQCFITGDNNKVSF